MAYTKEQLELARNNTTPLFDCPGWMQKLFYNAPRGKLFWKRTRKPGWMVEVGEPWAGGIYRIAENYEGEIE